MKFPLHAAYACLTILVCGCSAHTLDAGSNTDADAAAPPPGVQWYSWPPSNDFTFGGVTCMAGGSSSVVGSWLGHFDDYVFPSGSNEIRIDLIEGNSADVPRGPCGKIVFGFGDPPPLPTDPAAFYPPGSASKRQPLGTVYEGFGYDFSGALDSSVDGGHVEFGITTRQIYKAWCEIQTSYFQAAQTMSVNAYDCVPSHLSWNATPDGGCEFLSFKSCQGSVCSLADPTPASCAQLALCAACLCQSDGCTVGLDNDVQLDIQFQGDAGSGNASFPLDGIHAFQVQRAP